MKQKEKVNEDNLEYLIKISDFVNLVVNHHTIDDLRIATLYKKAFEICIKNKKKISLLIMVESKIKIQTLTDMLSYGGDL